jgi:DNA-binding Lrp family transcriptional regulator
MTMNGLEKEGVVKEYTMIPDFCKLGFSLILLIMFKFKLRPLSPEGVE